MRVGAAHLSTLRIKRGIPVTVPSPEDIFRAQVHAGLVDRDVESFVALFSDDCVVQDIAEGVPRRGLRELRDWIASYHAVMTNTNVEYLTVASDASRIVGEFVLRGVYRGHGAAAGGTPVELHYCVVDEVRDGLVAVETVYWAPQELDRQLPGQRS